MDSSRNLAGTSSSTSSSYQPSKRARYSTDSSRSRDKGRLAKSLLGFEEEQLKPVWRSTLKIEPCFFPDGIKPRDVYEIKGPEKSGKTFLLTYIIARVLSTFTEKKVVLIDTRHKFSVKNFASMISHMDPELKTSYTSIIEKLNAEPLQALQEYPKISMYLDRIMVFPCYTPENLLFTLGPSGESQLKKLLLRDKDICLVAVDGMDEYSFAESVKHLEWAQQWPNIMDLLKEAVNDTKCPVICTTLMMAHKSAYWNRWGDQKTRTEAAEGKGDESGGIKQAETAMEEEEEEQEEKLEDNFRIKHSIFTQIIELVPCREAELESLRHPLIKNINHLVTAYLRSKHSANTAGSGENHRVKFSIFSDMLWFH